MHPLSSRSVPLLVLAFLVALGCGGDGLTLPGDSTPTRLVTVTGDAQAGIAGSTLPLPLVVKVTDQLDRPVAHQRVAFAVQSGGGDLSSGSVTTDADGRASSSWTLGPEAGGQEVMASVVSAAALTQGFTATAVAGSGTLIAAVRGNDQSAAVNSALADPLVIRVSDGLGNPVSGVTIQWAVQGGGSITPETIVTGSDGRATASRVLGPAAGQQSATASADGLAGSPVTFVHTAVPSNPTELLEVSGNGQSAAAGTAAPEDLVVQLNDASGNGVGGRAVTWVISTGGGAVDPVNSTTDANGNARTRWTLGGSVGQNTLNAVFSGLPPVAFSATAAGGAPASITIAVAPSAAGQAGVALATQPQVRLRDAGGNTSPTAGVTVTASIASGPGGSTLSNAMVNTDASGVASFSGLAIEGPAGTYTLTFGSPSLAAATSGSIVVSAGPAANLTFSTQPPFSVGSNAPFAVAVSITDAFGNPADATVHLNLNQAVSGGTAILTGNVDVPSSGGLATFPSLSVDQASFFTYSLTASVSGTLQTPSNGFFVTP